MQRRTFTKILGAGAALSAQPSKAMSEPIEVGVITHAGGAHLGAYFSALADTPEVNRVVLSDEGGENATAARSFSQSRRLNLSGLTRPPNFPPTPVRTAARGRFLA